MHYIAEKVNSVGEVTFAQSFGSPLSAILELRPQRTTEEAAILAETHDWTQHLELESGFVYSYDCASWAIHEV